MGGDRVYTGGNCEWIDLNLVSSNADCDIGDKFVLKNKAGENRRQFLFVDGKTILAFVPQGQKFPQCSSYTEVTVQVDCRRWWGLWISFCLHQEKLRQQHHLQQQVIRSVKLAGIMVS